MEMVLKSLPLCSERGHRLGRQSEPSVGRDGRRALPFPEDSLDPGPSVPESAGSHSRGLPGWVSWRTNLRGAGSGVWTQAEARAPGGDSTRDQQTSFSAKRVWVEWPVCPCQITQSNSFYDPFPPAEEETEGPSGPVTCLIPHCHPAS